MYSAVPASVAGTFPLQRLEESILQCYIEYMPRSMKVQMMWARFDDVRLGTKWGDPIRAAVPREFLSYCTATVM
jgi:hypothetical protein